MGQAISNLISILFGRKQKVETTDEENDGYYTVIHCEEVKPLIHPTSRDGKAGISEKDEEDGYKKVVHCEEVKLIYPNSGYGKTRVSEKGEGAVVIDIIDAEIREDVDSFPPASGGRKTMGKRKKGKAEKGGVLQEGRRIKHYNSSHKILLVGEGDFSFSACLAKVFGSADNMVATSLNSEDFLKKNYSNAMSNINDLKSRGCVICHGVDATTMSCRKFLKGMRFDRIVFNFPHAGFNNKESRESQISRHQKLVTLFFKNAKKMLSEEGEIHISHKSTGFHRHWNIESLASLNGLNFIKVVTFNLNDYPGYNTKYGFGGDENFDCILSKTYMFGL